MIKIDILIYYFSERNNNTNQIKMKKRILNIFTIVAIGFALAACKDKAKEADTSDAKAATVTESTTEKFIVNVAGSTVEWKGFKPTGTHNGTINIENGVVSINDGKVHSGTFLLNMNSLVSTDLEGEWKDKLEAHLKGTVEGKEGDFFNVAKFPTAAFEVTGSEDVEGKTNLSGNLTLKGVKNNITFPVSVATEGDVLTITSEAFTIDRTKWGVNYGSKTIFDNLGDKFVNDEMEMKITVKAKKS